MHELSQNAGKALMVTVIFAVGLFSSVALAQEATIGYDVEAATEDVETIESIIAATYESIARAPGENFDWDRFLSLFLKEAILISNTEQSGGNFRVLSPQDFVDWISSVTTIGGAGDKGFAEEGYHNKIDRYGDVANVMSSYQKHYWGEENILGRGINSFQLVWNSDRWWVTGIAWDETYAAGPIPEKYGGERAVLRGNSDKAEPCSAEWYERIEEIIGTGDGQGHGPDPGTNEWKSTVIFRLGLRDDPEIPPLESPEWCKYVDQIARNK